MKNSKSRTLSIAGYAILVTTTALAIGSSILVTADESGEDIRDSYHEHLLREDMHSMANSVRMLLALNHMNEINIEERKKRVLRQLLILEGTARIIDEDAEIYNYSVKNLYMGSFLHDVDMAREFALMDPPDFEPSAGLIKSCLLCHQTLD